MPRGPFSPPFLGPCWMGRATSFEPLAPHSRIEPAPPACSICNIKIACKVILHGCCWVQKHMLRLGGTPRTQCMVDFALGIPAPTKVNARRDSRRVRGAAARLKNSACSDGYRFSSSWPYSSQDPVVSSRSCTCPHSDLGPVLKMWPQAYICVPVHSIDPSCLLFQEASKLSQAVANIDNQFSVGMTYSIYMAS